MPTFRNDTARWIDHWAVVQHPAEEPRKILVRFAPGEEKGLEFWLPHVKLGLTLVDPDWPKAPNTILTSGTYAFEPGVERKFDIAPCDTYIVNVIVQQGRLMLFPGSGNVGVEIVQSADVPFHYRAVFDWEYAPYLRATGLEAGTRATVHAEVDRAWTIHSRGGGPIWP